MDSLNSDIPIVGRWDGSRISNKGAPILLDSRFRKYIYLLQDVLETFEIVGWISEKKVSNKGSFYVFHPVMTELLDSLILKVISNINSNFKLDFFMENQKIVSQNGVFFLTAYVTENGKPDALEPELYPAIAPSLLKTSRVADAKNTLKQLYTGPKQQAAIEAFISSLKTSLSIQTFTDDHWKSVVKAYNKVMPRNDGSAADPVSAEENAAYCSALAEAVFAGMKTADPTFGLKDARKKVYYDTVGELSLCCTDLSDEELQEMENEALERTIEFLSTIEKPAAQKTPAKANVEKGVTRTQAAPVAPSAELQAPSTEILRQAVEDLAAANQSVNRLILSCIGVEV